MLYVVFLSVNFDLYFFLIADTTDSTSTMTNEDESSYELSSDHHPVSYQPLVGLECTTTPSSPSADELELMRSKGAIPKHYQRHSTHQTWKESTPAAVSVSASKTKGQPAKVFCSIFFKTVKDRCVYGEEEKEDKAYVCFLLSFPVIINDFFF